MSTSLNSLSPELVNQILSQTLDYSVFVNNRQLKKISLVCKNWSEIARRLLVREVHITDGDALWGLKEVLEKFPTLALSIRSISFGSPGSPVATQDDEGVSDDSDLLALAELCTSYNIPRPDKVIISFNTRDHSPGPNSYWTPKFPKSKRLLQLSYPLVERDNYALIDTDDYIKPNAAIDCLLSVETQSFTHLKIDGTNMREFERECPPPWDDRSLEFLGRLVSIDLSNLAVDRLWLEWFIVIGAELGGLKRLKFVNLESLREQDGRRTTEIISRLIERAGARLEELTWLDEKGNAGVVDRAVVSKLERLTHLTYNLKSYRLSRKIPSYIFSLPSTLHQLTLVTEVIFPHAFHIVRHLATSTRHSIRSITIEYIFPRNDSQLRFFPPLALSPFPLPTTPSDLEYRTISTVRQLRLSKTRIEHENLRQIIRLLGPSLHYLALDSIDCLPPFDLLQLHCQDLRWLEFGSIEFLWEMTENPRDFDLDTQWDASVNDSDDDGDTEEEHLEASKQTPPMAYTSAEIMDQSSLFEPLSFPLLDYLLIDLRSLISLVSVNTSIKADKFPRLKVLDIAGLRDPDCCAFGMGKKTVLEGLEELWPTCKEKGIVLASEGKPMETMSDLWWHLAARPARGVNADEQ